MQVPKKSRCFRSSTVETPRKRLPWEDPAVERMRESVTSEGNICEFLRRADEEVMSAGRGWGDYHQAMAILELLMEARVQHGDRGLPRRLRDAKV
jgi:hypothetical protein